MSRDSSAGAKDVLSLEGIEPVDLLGQNDRNLRVIESSMGGKVVVRGDQVLLSGQAHQVQELKRVLAGLIEMVRRKRALSEEDVRYAIESRDHGESTATLVDEPILINSRREPVVLGRTPGEPGILEHLEDFRFAVLGDGP